LQTERLAACFGYAFEVQARIGFTDPHSVKHGAGEITAEVTATTWLFMCWPHMFIDQHTHGLQAPAGPS